MKLIYKIFENIIGAFKYLVAFILVKTKYSELYNRNIWLICEKINEARDNSFHLFEYIRTNEKQTNIYYIIEKNSPDLKNIQKYENIIYFNTLKHYMYYIAAEVCISSQTLPYPCSRSLCNVLKKLKNKKQKTVWLQHGITKDLLEHKDMDYLIYKYDLLSCAVKEECDFIKETYGYPDTVAKTIGFCRYDKLFNVKDFENIILVMPTHRKWINLDNKKNYANKSKSSKFLETEFFKEYIGFLNSKQLEKLLDEYNYSLIFYPHYALQNYIKIFEKSCTNKRVIIADRKKYDVQDLLIKSKVLITDYSSVFFDFAFMKKPGIFFQFDERKYRESHYKEGYFNYKRDGFGKVVHNRGDLLIELEEVLKSEAVSPIYMNRIEQFFTIRDNQNCKRTYKAISNIL